MKNKILLLAIFILIAFTQYVEAMSISPMISYQGILRDNSGNLINGNPTITFNLYDNPIAGNLLWSETKNVQVSNGLFNTQLGDVTPLDPAHFDRALWLEITVGADTLSPRQQLMGAPYAFSLAPDAVISGDTHNHDDRYFNKSYVDALEARVAKLESILSGVTRSGNNIYIDGANLNIRDGSGTTDGPVNGTGNLIIGYNEVRGHGFDHKTGSHNLIIGSRNNYRSYGGLVTGFNNEISGAYASVSGGWDNTAGSDYSSVSGGFYNRAAGESSSVSGGWNNIALGSNSSVSGGNSNTASGNYSTVSGGSSNTANGGDSSVSGGSGNTASGGDSSVSGGWGNIASGRESSVSGGSINTASGSDSSASGGSGNTASGGVSSVSGGTYNLASGPLSSVSGGGLNNASGYYSSVSGGGMGEARGGYSSVSGGDNNIAIGDISSVSGGYGGSASGKDSSVSGGEGGTAPGIYSSVSGGYHSDAGGPHDWKGGVNFWSDY